MARVPQFKPMETPKQNYDQGAVNWSFVRFKYGKPFGPNQKQYDPYYTYTVFVNLNGQEIEHRWFPNVDEHKLIQMAGTVNNTVLAVTYVKEDKRRGLVAMYSAGPQQVRDQATVDAETEAALLEMSQKNGTQQNTALPPVVLPPQQPTYPPPPQQAVAPTPPQPPAQSPVPPPQPPRQPPPPPTTQPPRHEPKRVEEKVYKPISKNENIVKVIGAVITDATEFRYLAFKEIEERFKDELPELPVFKKPTLAQQMELAKLTADRMRLIVDLSAPINMKADKKIYHMFENGDWYTLAGSDIEQPTPTVEKSPPVTKTGDIVVGKTREESLEIINDLDLAQYGNPKTLVLDWLKNVASPVETIGSWKHAGNICVVLGLNTETLVDAWGYDADYMLMLTQAIWDYNGARVEGMNRNDALTLIAEEYGLPVESMQFKEEETSE
jgi:hypothetical protein